MNSAGKVLKDSAPELPRCKGCVHYYITHDIRCRDGCRALGFKSPQQPSRVVIAAAAQAGRYFASRK